MRTLRDLTLNEQPFIFGYHSCNGKYNPITCAQDLILEMGYLCEKLGSFLGEALPNNFFKDLNRPTFFSDIVEKNVTNGQGYVALPHSSFARESMSEELDNFLPYDISNIQFTLYAMEIKNPSVSSRVIEFYK